MLEKIRPRLAPRTRPLTRPHWYSGLLLFVAEYAYRFANWFSARVVDWAWFTLLIHGTEQEIVTTGNARLGPMGLMIEPRVESPPGENAWVVPESRERN